MDFSSLSLSELQEQCERRGLFPCRGPGITKRVLINKLEGKKSGKKMNEAEKRILEHDPKLHESIRRYIARMPDFRPKETVAQMGGGKQDNWATIAHELEALAFNEEDADFVDAVNQEDQERIDSYIRESGYARYFAQSYPALLWLMLKTNPLPLMKPILIASGEYLENVLPLPNNFKTASRLLDYVRDWDTAEFLYKNYVKTISANSQSFLTDWLMSQVKMNNKQYGIGAAYVISFMDENDIRFMKDMAPYYNKQNIIDILKEGEEITRKK